VILDTNGLSAVAAGEPALEPILRKAAQVAIPVIVLGEYRYGISQSRGRDRYEQWLSEYLPKFRILDVDDRTTIFLRCRSYGAKEGRNTDSIERRLDCSAVPSALPYREPRPTFRRRAGGSEGSTGDCLEVCAWNHLVPTGEEFSRGNANTLGTSVPSSVMPIAAAVSQFPC